MCRIMEELNARSRKDQSEIIAINMLINTDLSLDKIAVCSTLSLDEVKEIATGLPLWKTEK